MLRLLTLTALVFAIQVTSAAAQLTTPSGAPAVGVFTLARVFSESTEGKDAVARVQAVQDRHAQVIEEKQKAAQAIEEALQTDADKLTEADRAQRARELEKLRVEIERLVQDAQAELGALQREVEAAFLEKLRPALDRVAKARGIQVVVNFDDGALLWSDPSLDLTDALIRELEPDFSARPNVLPFVAPLTPQ